MNGLNLDFIKQVGSVVFEGSFGGSASTAASSKHSSIVRYSTSGSASTIGPDSPSHMTYRDKEYFENLRRCYDIDHILLSSHHRVQSEDDLGLGGGGGTTRSSDWNLYRKVKPATSTSAAAIHLPPGPCKQKFLVRSRSTDNFFSKLRSRTMSITDFRLTVSSPSYQPCTMRACLQILYVSS